MVPFQSTHFSSMTSLGTCRLAHSGLPYLQRRFSQSNAKFCVEVRSSAPTIDLEGCSWPLGTSSCSMCVWTCSLFISRSFTRDIRDIWGCFSECHSLRTHVHAPQFPQSQDTGSRMYCSKLSPSFHHFPAQNLTVASLCSRCRSRSAEARAARIRWSCSGPGYPSKRISRSTVVQGASAGICYVAKWLAPSILVDQS